MTAFSLKLRIVVEWNSITARQTQTLELELSHIRISNLIFMTNSPHPHLRPRPVGSRVWQNRNELRNVIKSFYVETIRQFTQTHSVALWIDDVWFDNNDSELIEHCVLHWRLHSPNIETYSKYVVDGAMHQLRLAIHLPIQTHSDSAFKRWNHRNDDVEWFQFHCIWCLNVESSLSRSDKHLPNMILRKFNLFPFGKYSPVVLSSAFGWWPLSVNWWTDGPSLGRFCQWHNDTRPHGK